MRKTDEIGILRQELESCGHKETGTRYMHQFQLPRNVTNCMDEYYHLAMRWNCVIHYKNTTHINITYVRK